MEPTDRSVEVVRVVVVSPGDVTAERKAVVPVVDELNRHFAPAQGCRLSVWRWDTDARAGPHLEGPRGLIDERMQISDADVVVGIFWKRFGSPAGDAASGAEHELRRASAASREHGRPDVMVCFCERSVTPATSGEAEQWLRVLRFREELPKEQLWWPYKQKVEFERLVRGHLEDVVLRRAGARKPPAAAAPAGGVSVSGLWFGVPALAAAFSGRSGELDGLVEALGGAGRVVIAQASTGLGGVGKTQLAARYVHTHGEEYDVVAWIDAEGGAIADFAALAVKLGERVEGLAPAARRELALERLARGNERWLLVLDNIASAAQLNDCLPSGGNGRVLVTSRNRELRQFAPVLELDVFDPGTATGYLIERAGRPSERAGAERLARALGYLPLALSHAGAYCAQGMRFADYLELLDVPAQERLDSSSEAFCTEAVASTWKASIELASAGAPLAGELLALAAHLAPGAIPRSLFNVVIDSGLALEHKRLRDGLDALARFSLATVDDSSVSVHRLLGKVVRDDARARADASAVKRAVAALEHAFPADPSDPAQWALSEQLLAHVIALVEAAVSVPDTAAQVIELLNRACEYLIWAEGGARGLALAQRIVKWATRMLAAEHPGTLTARHHQALACQQTGRVPEAIDSFEALLADRERILGAEHPDTLRTCHALAVAYLEAGRVEEAIAIYEPLLADCEQIFGAEHPSTVATLHALAGAYQEAGRTREAIAMLESVLAERERSLGPTHAHTLATRQALAGAYGIIGRDADADALEPGSGSDSSAR